MVSTESQVKKLLQFSPQNKVLIFFVAGTLNDYHHPRNIPQAVKKAVEPLFKKLTSRELLTRCLGGYTQNNNESFNGMIWTIAPKVLSSGLRVLESAVYLSVCLFNEGNVSLLKVMEKIGIRYGERARKGLEARDARHMTDAHRASQHASKEARQRNLRKRKSAQESALQDNDLFYLAGGFD